MGYEIVIRGSNGRERSFPLAERTVIGRETRCDLRVSLPSVANRHCEIVMNGSIVELKDLGSDGGTFHNGDRIERVVLGDCDRIRIGSVTLEIRRTS